MIDLLFINWDPNPIPLQIGSFSLRWYSIFWMIAILTGYYVVTKVYNEKKLPSDKFQSMGRKTKGLKRVMPKNG